MKVISTLFLLAAFFTAQSQAFKLTGGYAMSIPQQQMAKNIQPDNGLEAGILYQLPKLKQLSFGIELGIGTYASKRVNQTFQFDNNVASVVPVDYTSNTFNADLVARFNLVKDKALIVPYLNAKTGMYNFFSTINIDDPNNPDGCSALQHRNIINDKTLYWSAGGGVQINPAIFSKHKDKGEGRLRIDIGANTVHGGNLDYINTKHLVDAQTVNDPAGKPLEVQFINVSTQQIHEHTVAQVYRSKLKMIEFRAGIVVALGN